VKVEIDQSGKIEETNKDTILAFSNKIKGAVEIKRKAKRQLLEIFRRSGQPKLFVYRTFAAGIFLLLEPYLKEIASIAIDVEWTGKERLICDIFFEFWQKSGARNKPEIVFQHLGKNSPAHILARESYRNKNRRKNLRKLSLQQICRLAVKNDRGLVE